MAYGKNAASCRKLQNTLAWMEETIASGYNGRFTLVFRDNEWQAKKSK